MKKTVTMICILKSGTKVEDSIKFNSKDTEIFEAINKIRAGIEKYLANPVPDNPVPDDKGYITFGGTTIALSEIAAISFAD